MPSNLVWSWPLHSDPNTSCIFMQKDGLCYKRGHAIIGFNDGLPYYVKNMALEPQSQQKPRPMASFFVYLSPSGHVFNIVWQAMIRTYNTLASERCVSNCLNVFFELILWTSCDISLRFVPQNSGLPTVTEFQYFVKEMRPWVRKFFLILAQNTAIFGYFPLNIAWKYWNFGICYWKSWNYSKLLLK